MTTPDHQEHDHPMTTTIPKAFTNPELLGSVIDARWEVTPEVRDRLAAQVADLTVHEVIERLVYQLTDDRDDCGDGTGGEYGGAWIEIGELRVINGQRCLQLREVHTADTATA